jgi:hypothetical protein
VINGQLLDSGPVGKWNYEIQQGVYNMTCLVIELIAIRLNQEGVPDILLNTLSLVVRFNFKLIGIHKLAFK